MRKVKITAFALVFSIFAWGQKSAKDSTYVNRPLKLDEINFVSGYADQSGSHSAIAGGNGSEELTDFMNNIDVKLIKSSGQYEHRFDFGLGVDHHSSASTAYINTPPTGAPTTLYNTNKTVTTSILSRASGGSSGGSGSSTHSESSASTLYGWRFYPSLNYSVKNLANNTTFGARLYYSWEFDYHSLGAELSFVKASMDNNKEFSAKVLAYFDQREYILPAEVATALGQAQTQDWRNKNNFSLNLAYSQVINKRLQISLLGDLAVQNGLLSTPYNRVYFNNNTVTNEKLPDNRFKIPVGIRANYF